MTVMLLVFTAAVSSSVHHRAMAPMFSVATGTTETCATTSPRALQITADHLHWLSSGAVSFARGLNDAPKIVALAGTVRSMALAWVVTLPAAALLGAGFYAVMSIAAR